MNQKPYHPLERIHDRCAAGIAQLGRSTPVKFFFLILGVSVFVPALDAIAEESPAEWKPVVYPYRDADSGMCMLKVNDFLLRQSERDRTVQLLSVWRYDPNTETWSKYGARNTASVTVKPTKREIYSSKTDTVLLDVTDELGLFWAKWKEDGHLVEMSVFSGPILCNDVDIGTPPPGRVAACVPFADHALAMFIPDPRVHCKEPKQVEPIAPANRRPVPGQR